MEQQKTKITSVLSNNTITKCETKRPKSGPRKKSKSSAEFQTIAVKKRGVYVENKQAKSVSARVTATETKIEEKQTVKPPPRPKPGSKRFLASVLTILSKSTTGTQCDAADRKKIKKKPVKIIEEKAPVECKKEEKKEKKAKFRSRILNNNRQQIDKFEVLQSKKEIIKTPSLYSERSYREDIRLSDLPRLVKQDDEYDVIMTKEPTMNNLVREVTEGKKLKEKKVTVNLEPTTLVADHKKDDNPLYKLFVDLLETTFSVYNVKAEYDAEPPSAASSKLALEMDESVARKLHVATDMFDDSRHCSHRSTNHSYSIKSDEDGWSDGKLINHFLTPPTKPELSLKPPAKRRKLKTESFVYTKPKIPAPLIKSEVMAQRKSFYRTSKKANLLNILKEQLRMSHVSYEEPQNLFQALKVIAKNKRRQKSIRFEGAPKVKPPPECMLQRRQVISLSNRWSKKYEEESMSSRSISQKLSDIGCRCAADARTMSDHSLEVYAFDNEVTLKKLPVKQKKREVFMTYHSSPETSEDLLQLNRQSSSSTIMDFADSLEVID